MAVVRPQEMILVEYHHGPNGGPQQGYLAAGWEALVLWLVETVCCYTRTLGKGWRVNAQAQISTATKNYAVCSPRLE
jgi:hypothetical protein